MLPWSLGQLACLLPCFLDFSAPLRQRLSLFSLIGLNDVGVYLQRVLLSLLLTGKHRTPAGGRNNLGRCLLGKHPLMGIRWLFIRGIS